MIKQHRKIRLYLCCGGLWWTVVAPAAGKSSWSSLARPQAAAGQGRVRVVGHATPPFAGCWLTVNVCVGPVPQEPLLAAAAAGHTVALQSPQVPAQLTTPGTHRCKAVMECPSATAEH